MTRSCLALKLFSICLLYSPVPVHAQLADMTISASVVDLTHQLNTDIPVFPGGVTLSVTKLTKDSDPYFLNQLKLGEHVGTHVDAPVHFATGGRDVASIPLKQLIAPLVVIDVRKECAANPDYMLLTEDVERWESNHGRMPENAVVAIWTGWQQKWGNPIEYVNLDSTGVPHFPGVSESAAQFLVAHRLAAGVAIDTLSVDPGISKTFPAHIAILERQAFNVENIANLDKVPPKGYTICVLPLPVSGGSGSPARVIAFPTPK
jgi:kynurenine formamidase